MKKCTNCGENKELSEFFKDKGQSSGLKPSCKTCCKKATRKWIEKNPNKRKFYILKSVSGVTQDQYNNILQMQNGKCAICDRTIEENGKNLSIDHCHETLKVRGLLCTKCNSGLGYFNDNENLLKKAINYLNIPLNINLLYKK